MSETSNPVNFYLSCILPIGIVIILFALTVFKHFTLRADQCNDVFDVRVNPSYQVEMKPIPGKYINTYYRPEKRMDLALRDFWIASSYRTYQPCGGTGDVVSYDTIRYVLQKGARAIHFDIYSSTPNTFYDSTSRPIVRNSTLMGVIGESLEFDRCMKIVSDHAWVGNSYPLLIYLEFHEPAAKNKYLLRRVAQSLAKYFSTRVLPPQYGYCRIPAGSIPIREAMGKVILLTNEYPLEANLNELLNGVISETANNTGMVYKYSKEHADFGGIKSTERNTEKIISFNQTHLSMVIPEHEINSQNQVQPKVDLHNPTPDDCWQHGFQMVFMNYQLYDKNMKRYIEQFKDAPFKVKVYQNKADPDRLRWIPKPKKKPQVQDPQLSYEPRRVTVHGNFFDHHL